MKDKFLSYVKKENMLSPGDTVWVALSGGADSTALLLLFDEAREELQITLKAIHVEHGIRGGESLQDADFAEALCARRRIPFVRVAVEVPAYAGEKGLGLEEAARLLRYQAFEEHCAGDSLALAHHMEDQAETVLFQLARGSGLDGLCGMAPIREEKGIRYLRPLLFASRQEIEDYLLKKGQTFCTDSTNTDLAYSRNRIRKQILPELTQVNAEALRHISESAERLSNVREYIRAEAGRLYRESAEEGEDWVKLPVSQLSQLPEALASELVRLAIRSLTSTLKDIGSRHIESLLDLTEMQSGRQLSLPYGIRAVREYEDILLISKAKEDRGGIAFEEGFAVTGRDMEEARSSGQPLLLPEGCGLLLRVIPHAADDSLTPKKPCTFWVDYDRLKDGFLLRMRQEGDWFYLNAAGDKKMLRRYFIDEKLPESRRDRIPVLAVENHVLWAWNRVCFSAYVTAQTKWVLEIVRE